MTSKTAETASVYDIFFSALLNWQKWVTSSLEISHRYHAAALSKSEGAKHCPHIHMDEKGECYLKCGMVWHRLTRESNEPFARYSAEVFCIVGGRSRARENYEHGKLRSLTNAEGETITFVKRSGDHPEEDWGWQVNPRTCRFGPDLPGIHYVDRKDIEATIRLYETGLAFSDVLLKRWGAVILWINDTAECEERDRTCDWVAFCEQFLPEPSQEIPSSAELEAALSRVFVELGKPS